MDNANETSSLRESYAEMAADQPREREAEEWSEALIGDVYADVPNAEPLSQGRNTRL
jgi:hypothetical protein